MRTHETFTEWFDVFQSKLDQMGYQGPIDRHTFECEWEEGKDPYDSAELFYEEITN